jgi:hypothetical protein
MRDSLPVGPYRILKTFDNHEVPWYILPFDECGICAAPLTRQDCLRRAAEVKPTDVFLFCHGWNNDWKYATEDRYEKFIRGYEQLRTENNLSYSDGYRPLLVGLFWPSAVLLFPDERAPQMAGIAAGTVSSGEDESVGIERQEIAELARELPPDHLGQFYELTQGGATWNEEAARALASLLLEGYQGGDDLLPGKLPGPTVDDLVGSWQATHKDLRAEPGRGPATVVGGTRSGQPTAAPFLGLPTPREIVRLFTVWRMKDRAKVVGEKGAGPLLHDLSSICNARIHVLGHSYGAQVTLAGICSVAMEGLRPIDSVLLLQPAVSAACFAKQVGNTGEPGRYRAAFERVHQPILATYSTHDQALYRYYHLAVDRYKDAGERRPAGIIPYYAALGGYGPKDCSAESQRQELLPATKEYARVPPPIRIVGLDGTKLISGHSDICNPATYWALYNQVTNRLVTS